MTRSNKVIFFFVLFGLSLPLSALAQNACPTPTLTRNWQKDPSWELQYDPGNPATISRGECTEIKIKGGEYPYGWSVKGGYGFRLASETEGMTNILCADNDSFACGGLITIRIQDVRGKAVAGYVGCLDCIPSPFRLATPSRVYIDVSSSKWVTVQGGSPPFSWRIGSESGWSGFSLGDPGATGPVNLVSTSQNATGTAYIHITDGCNSPVKATLTVCSKYYVDDDYYFSWTPSSTHKCSYFYHRTIYNSSDDSVVHSAWKTCKLWAGTEQECNAHGPIRVDYGCTNTSGYTMCYGIYCQDEGPDCGKGYWCYGTSGSYE